MILSKKVLNQIINEEFAAALKGRKRRLAEARPTISDDVLPELRGKCLLCGAQAEECVCEEEPDLDNLGDWGGVPSFKKLGESRKRRLTESFPRPFGTPEHVGPGAEGEAICHGCGAPEGECACGPQVSEPCPQCGSENTEPSESLPSMMGYGTDCSVHCHDCDSNS